MHFKVEGIWFRFRSFGSILAVAAAALLLSGSSCEDEECGLVIRFRGFEAHELDSLELITADHLNPDIMLRKQYPQLHKNYYPDSTLQFYIYNPHGQVQYILRNTHPDFTHVIGAIRHNRNQECLQSYEVNGKYQSASSHNNVITFTK